ncbi:MAG: amidohydrolase [Armatimonadota bacterium]|nr:amidohydrolase [Armatimonadota bacterium]MDR7485918.1 amidohydrolase [Armatimonadota bacterium]MDR7533131.1 amidohydrolase [Armatimonadota bacterium]MDR7536623.1 amidohydrolase [Armatimonadota bacterium]
MTAAAPGGSPASTLIRGARIVTCDGHDVVYPEGDLLLTGERIAAVGPRIEAPGAQVVDARGRLAMPGLINAHMHSDETLFRGLLDGMPLEVWMLYSLPPLGYGPVPERLIYLRTLLAGIEALQSGVTTVQDDVSEAPLATVAGSQAVLQAYLDVGVRASVACNMTDVPYEAKLPYLAALLPAWARDALGAAPVQSTRELVALAETLLEAWHGRDGRIRIALSASAPQRCTPELILALDDLSRRWRVPLLTHALETKVQVATGRAFYGKTVVAYLADLGVLSDRLTIAHGIWLTDQDIDLLAAAGTAVAHNPISNLKLGSGLLRYHALRRAGVPLCLGTDGASSNDTFNMFEVMKCAALLHKIASPVAEAWPSARDVLDATLRGGARSTLLQGQVGILAPGAYADVVLLRLDAPAFIPWHVPANHLVYCQSGRDVDKVFVGGRLVVDGGRVVTVDAAAVYAEIAGHLPGFAAMVDRAYAASRRLEPILWQVYERCQREVPEMNRFATPPADWPWLQRG